MKRFPTFAIVLLVVGVIWLLNDMGFLRINIPIVPVVIILIALVMLFNRKQ